MGKVFCDICRWERNVPKDHPMHTDEELKKELDNMIVSTIRWCDDLGYDPKKCIERDLKNNLIFKKKQSACFYMQTVFDYVLFCAMRKRRCRLMS